MNEVTPDPEWLQIQQAIAGMISQKGRAIITVQAEGTFKAFGYTVGNHLKGYPELLLINAPTENDYDLLLNSLSKQVITRKRAFVDGEPLKRNKFLKGMVYDCHDQAKGQYTWQAGQYFEGEDYRVQQVVLADEKGLMPMDARCNPKFQVPILRKLVLS